jgi:hypothetical protein
MARLYEEDVPGARYVLPAIGFVLAVSGVGYVAHKHFGPGEAGCEQLHGSASLMIGPKTHFWSTSEEKHKSAVTTSHAYAPVQIGNRPGMTDVCVIDKYNGQTRERMVGFEVGEIPGKVTDSFGKGASERIDENDIKVLWVNTHDAGVEVRDVHLDTVGDTWPQ